MENIVIQNADLTVEISPKGAEVQRIVDREGIDRLWDGDPAFWAGRSPVLFPVAGALVDGRYTLDGQAYALGKHGFARESMFRVSAQDASSATFILTAQDAPQAGFPFDYAFEVRYTLQENRLHTAYRTENRGGQTFYFSCGAHEAYACPEGIEAYAIEFADDEGTVEHSVLAGAFLSGQTRAIPLSGRTLPLHADLFADDTLVLASLRSRQVRLKTDRHQRDITVDFSDFPYLLIWTMPGAGYLCIEPWHNLPDTLSTDGNIANKPGMIALPPGEARTLTHTVTFAKRPD